MADNVASTVVLASPTAPAPVVPATPTPTPTPAPVKVKLDLGLKADGTPRLRRMRGTGPAHRARHPKVSSTYFAVNTKTGVLTKLESEEATLEYLATSSEAKDTMVIRGQQLVTTMRVVLAEVR
jgi:hypothetical protein